ncbi:MAG TPA: hypothetical protein VJ802_04040 [Gemmatimonadaceae bacterium]|nr:hypothetical protein [Gemmatimonadaceae bacterium]
MKRIPLLAGRAVQPIARLALGLGVLTAAVSCTDDGPSTAPATQPPVQSVESRAQGVAQGIALALADRQVREGVRDAMRASLWTEHKLSLNDFVNTPAGRALLEAAARARHSSVEEFQREIDALPRLDFYMPLREHRRMWTGSDNVAVVAAWEGKGDAAGYLPDGGVIAVSRVSAEGLPPTFFIQPGQRKGLRVGPQANTKGLVIEDANDGVGSEVFVWHSGRGDSTVIDMALPDAEARLEALSVRIAAEQRRSLLTPSIIEVCDPQAIVCEYPTNPAPAPTGPADTTRIATFYSFMCDHTWCWEAGEYRFDAFLRPASLAYANAYGSYYRDGLRPFTLHELRVPLIFRRIVDGTADYMNVHITEEDRGDFLGFNLDDDCGTVTLRWQDNGVRKQYPNKFNGNNADCHGLELGSPIAIEAMYSWTPRR